MKYGLVAIVFLLSLSLCAQTAPQLEIFGAGSYFRADISPDLAQFGVAHIDNYGWHVAASEYLNRWFGGTVDISGNYGRPTITIPANTFGPGIPATNQSISDALNTSTYTILFGPSFAYRKSERLQPFAHVLLGAVNARAKTTSKGTALVCGATGICPTILLDGNSLEVTGSSIKMSDTVFGYAFGAGLDTKVATHWAIRAQADFIRSQFADFGDDRQNNVRVSGGVVFRFGSR